MTETLFRLKRHLTSFQIMILGFAGVILLGALVLMLPIATVQRVWTPFHEALFTSTSAVCVTGWWCRIPAVTGPPSVRRSFCC